MPKQIKVKDETYDELTSLGKKNETYDDIIQKCIEAYKKVNKL
jgi:predicted CopG family antitoxin